AWRASGGPSGLFGAAGGPRRSTIARSVDLKRRPTNRLSVLHLDDIERQRELVIDAVVGHAGPADRPIDACIVARNLLDLVTDLCGVVNGASTADRLEQYLRCIVERGRLRIHDALAVLGLIGLDESDHARLVKIDHLVRDETLGLLAGDLYDLGDRRATHLEDRLVEADLARLLHHQAR